MIASPAMIAARMVRSLTDTQPQTLVTPLPQPAAADRQAHPRPPRRRRGLWGVPLAAISLLVLVAIVVAALLPARLVASKDVERDGEAVSEDTPYAVVPASVQAVADRVSYADLGADVAVDTDPDGRVFFVTVSEPAQSVLGWWVAEDEPEIRFLTNEEKFGSQTPSQRRTVALQMMRTSSQVAQYVALTLAGYDPELVPGPVQIEQMLCLDIDGQRCVEYVPSADQLDDGDTIVAVDGTDIAHDRRPDRRARRTTQPGDTVAVTVDRVDVGEVDVEVELMESPDEPGKGIIGFVPFDTTSVRLPFEIAFDTGQIGGPSAGLAFTLTLLDELTEGDLLGGVDVAVTGTIQLDGTSGRSAGCRRRCRRSARPGIEHFIVPAGQSEADMASAREIAGDDVELIVVANIDEALAALERLGGDPLPDGGMTPTPQTSHLRWGCGHLVLAPRPVLAGVGARRQLPDRAPRVRPAGGPRVPAHGRRRTGPHAGARALPRPGAAVDAAASAGPPPELDDETLARLLGEETTRILQAARESAAAIRSKAEEAAERMLREAREDAQHLRDEADSEASRRRRDAEQDAEAELEMAKQQGREMVEEARAYRERVLSELSRRRDLARQQIDQLVHGRDRLVQAFERARLVAADVVAELAPLGELSEYVNLSPTTGPVPVMVPASRLGEISSISDEVLAARASSDPDDPALDPNGSPTPRRRSTPASTPAPAAATTADEPSPSSTRRRGEPTPTSQAAAPPPPTTGATVLQFPDRRADTVVIAPGSEAEDDLESERHEPDDDGPDEDGVRRCGCGRGRRGRRRRHHRQRRRQPVRPAALGERRPTRQDDAATEPATESAEPAAPTPFELRDEALTPLIVSSGRKLKRVLADEQNDVLDRLRGKKPVRSIDDLLPAADEQATRYFDAIAGDLRRCRSGRRRLARRLGRRAGAPTTTSPRPGPRRPWPATSSSRCAIASVAGIEAVDGDNEELTKKARAIYREWKTRRIDDQLDDLLRHAYSRGAFAAFTDGQPVRWVFDPAVGACSDCEDNSLQGRGPRRHGVPDRPRRAPGPRRLPLPGRAGRLTRPRRDERLRGSARPVARLASGRSSLASAALPSP